MSQMEETELVDAESGTVLRRTTRYVQMDPCAWTFGCACLLIVLIMSILTGVGVIPCYAQGGTRQN